MAATIASPRRKATLHVLVSLAALVISWAPHVGADHEHYCGPDSYNRERRGQCGESLANSVHLACLYFARAMPGKYVVKRSYPSEIDRDVHDLLVQKKDAFSFLSKRQSSQDIICECCVNSCSFFELTQYCPVLNSRRVRSEFPKTGV